MSKYTEVCIFTKNTNLLEYFKKDKISMPIPNQQQYNSWREYYAKEREVQLIAMFRWENGKCFCKIKCPINPLPVKGEFETPHGTSPIHRFLAQNGWTFKEKLYPHMFE